MYILNMMSTHDTQRQRVLDQTAHAGALLGDVLRVAMAARQAAEAEGSESHLYSSETMQQPRSLDVTPVIDIYHNPGIDYDAGDSDRQEAVSDRKSWHEVGHGELKAILDAARPSTFGTCTRGDDKGQQKATRPGGWYYGVGDEIPKGGACRDYVDQKIPKVRHASNRVAADGDLRGNDEGRQDTAHSRKGHYRPGDREQKERASRDDVVQYVPKGGNANSHGAADGDIRGESADKYRRRGQHPASHRNVTDTHHHDDRAFRKFMKKWHAEEGRDRRSQARWAERTSGRRGTEHADRYKGPERHRPSTNDLRGQVHSRRGNPAHATNDDICRYDESKCPWHRKKAGYYRRDSGTGSKSVDYRNRNDSPDQEHSRPGDWIPRDIWEDLPKECQQFIASEGKRTRRKRRRQRASESRSVRRRCEDPHADVDVQQHFNVEGRHGANDNSDVGYGMHKNADGSVGGDHSWNEESVDYDA